MVQGFSEKSEKSGEKAPGGPLGTAQAVAECEPSVEDVEAILDESRAAEDGNLIGVLQEIQGRFGYLSASALKTLSRRMRIPLSRIYGVVSFYSQFFTAPRGRHTVRCCRGTACHVRGAGRIIDTIRRNLSIEEGQTTPDMQFYLEAVACLGTCFLAPVMMIDDQYFGKLTPQRVAGIFKSYRGKES